MANKFESLKQVGFLAAGLAAATPDAQANIVHMDSETPRHELAQNVHYEDAETKKLMAKWGIEFYGTDIRLRMDSRDNGRPLEAGKSNKDITFGHEGSDTITIDWREPDGDHGRIWIKSGRETGSTSTNVGQSEGRSRGDHQQAGGSSSEHRGAGHTYGEYGKVRLYGIHAQKPPADPEMKWYYHNPKGEEEKGWWYQAREGSR